MARLIERLSPLEVRNAKPPKGKASIMLADGQNLHLQVTRGKNGSISRSWVFLFELRGHRHGMGLGPLVDVGLKEAREKARQYRGMLRDKINPLEERRKEHAARKAEAAKQITFEQMALDYIAFHEGEWKSDVHRKQWRSSLETYVFPTLRKLAPQQIDPAIVFKTIEPVWKTKAPTAKRVLNRIELVLDFAASKGFRTGDNPAAHILKSLPKRPKGEHHAAMPHGDVPRFMLELAERDSIATRAVRFAILTAARSGEVLGATRDEIDAAEKVWTIPAARMKAGIEHRVPLTSEALRLLDGLPREGRLFDYNTKLGRIVRKMRPGLTLHGFRSSFRQWAAEKTNFPDHIAEQALAHATSTGVEKAYKRKAEMFDRRRKLMEAWARHCCTPPVEVAADNVVVPLRA